MEPLLAVSDHVRYNKGLTRTDHALARLREMFKVKSRMAISYVKNIVETTPFHRIIFLSLYEKGILVEGLLYEIYFGLGTS